ncbi:hypothetical protein GRAN_1630 [Granulicella sibirica]|uniref:Uncharacterized protein n=1 Tax=Granulicella sibirica TaxID=2479048 RepID=A0A4Q0T6N7_9BACT|nr:hypothetical protein GRAN_1630 [Granulicella sibirica]
MHPVELRDSGANVGEHGLGCRGIDALARVGLVHVGLKFATGSNGGCCTSVTFAYGVGGIIRRGKAKPAVADALDLFEFLSVTLSPGRIHGMLRLSLTLLSVWLRAQRRGC